MLETSPGDRARLLAAPLATAELLAVDTETNGLGGERCELTEVGAVLVGGGELHDRWSSLCRVSAPLRRGIERMTGISQAMVDDAPVLEQVLPRLAERMRGRVLVAHNAPFDRRVLRQAFDRIGLAWPDPPVICTAALARRLLPLQRSRGLTALADALGIEVALAHRALPDAETCGRVLCALFGRLCAHAATVADALALLGPARPRPRRRGSAEAAPLGRTRRVARPPAAVAPDPALEFARLPTDPGVYLFRDGEGKVLYVGKSVSIRSRARAHFAPSAPTAAWRAHARVVDYRTTTSELGALMLEAGLIAAHAPPGNSLLTRRDDRLVYIRCRLDIEYPILEVARDPASGHGVSIGPVHGRRLASELVEQLDSLFGLRHCGRRLPRREHPSAYGQMGRCLSPCLGDLDPNLYRRRLDAALRLFTAPGDEPARPLLDHVWARIRAASAARRYEQAAALHRRAGRLRTILARLDGVLEATHARPRLVAVAHPSAARAEGFWVAGGRVVDRGELALDDPGLAERTAAAVRRGGRIGELGAHIPPAEVAEIRTLGTWLASRPQTPRLALDPLPDAAALRAFVARVVSERERDDGRGDPVAADPHA